MYGLSWIEIIYWAATVIGGTLFILRTLLMFAGGLGEGDLDLGHDFDADLDTHFDIETDHLDTDVGFKLLSLQGITAFFMMFGLVGLATFHSGWSVLLTLFAGTVAGLFTVWVISYQFAMMSRLQSQGNINLRNAIGEVGTVYLTLKANGSGQVRVTVQGALKIFTAVAADKKKIATGAKVRVTDVVSGNTLVVEKY